MPYGTSRRVIWLTVINVVQERAGSFTMKRKTSGFTETLVLSININGFTSSDPYYHYENSKSHISNFCLPTINNINMAGVRTALVVVTLALFHVQSEELCGSRSPASIELLI
jgi:hypothetical protein